MAGGPISTIWDHGGPHQSHQTTIHTPATTQFSSKGISWKCGYWHHPHPTTCKPWISLYPTKGVTDWPWLKNMTSICWWHLFQLWLKNSLLANCDHNKSICYHTFSTSTLLSCIFKQLIKTALCKLNLPLHQQCGSGIHEDPKRPYCTSVTSGCTVNETTFWSRFKHTDGNCLEHRIEHASFSHIFFEIVPFLQWYLYQGHFCHCLGHYLIIFSRTISLSNPLTANNTPLKRNDNVTIPFQFGLFMFNHNLVVVPQF